MTVEDPPSQPFKERRRWAREQPQGDIGQPVRSALKPLLFSTAGLPKKEQFRAWEAYSACIVDVRLPDDASADDGFVASHATWNLGGMLVTQQSVSAHRYQRSEAKLRSSLIDHWSVLFRRTGKSWTEVGGAVAEGQPGSIEIRSLGHSFRGRMLESEYITLYLPRDLFADAVGLLDANNNFILSKNLAGVLANYFASIEARLSKFTQEELPSVVKATRDLIIACVSSSEDRAPVSASQATIAPIERARRLIRSNLRSNTITPDLLCKELGISRTYLYQLFEPSGGVMHYIQKQRLLAGHVALSDPGDRRQISMIAESLGFSSSADFSRAFSREFGYSPREARNLVAPANRTQPADNATPTESLSFEGWLKSLGS